LVPYTLGVRFGQRENNLLLNQGLALGIDGFSSDHASADESKVDAFNNFAFRDYYSFAS
jgi:hypothetical protein